jgi:hypothetical protein
MKNFMSLILAILFFSQLFSVEINEKQSAVLVKFKSIPGNADLVINNSVKGKTNRDLFLYPGRYEIKLIKDNYLVLKDSIIVSETGDNTFRYKMTKNSGFINIVSNPVNAKVFINYETVNNKSIELSPGLYRLDIKAESYDSVSEMVEVKIGDKIDKSFNLNPRYGELSLSVYPNEAKIEISKNRVVVKSFIGSMDIHELPEGDYKVIARAKGYKLLTKKVVIDKQKKSELNIEMQKGSDNLKNYVYVEGGSFLMGEIKGEFDEKPVHKVTVNSFYIGKYEVTLKDWSELYQDSF